MAKKPDIPQRIIDAAMTLAAQKGWRDLSLAEIAAAAKLPLSKVYPVFPSKPAILRGLSRRADAEVLAGEDPEAREGSARDRLFDVLMRRFDALAPYKEALGHVLYDVGRDPVAACGALTQFRRSMACMVEAADLSAAGVRGALRVKAVGLVYLDTLRVWLRDDSPDLAKTMAALDRDLRRLEVLARFGDRPGAGPNEGPGESPDPAA